LGRAWDVDVVKRGGVYVFDAPDSSEAMCTDQHHSILWVRRSWTLHR